MLTQTRNSQTPSTAATSSAMSAVPPSPTRSTHSSRSSRSINGDMSDHDDVDIHSLSSHSDHDHNHERPTHPTAHGYSSSDDWSASDAEVDDFDLVASRDLVGSKRGSVSGASSEADEASSVAGEGSKMRLSFPDPMARDHDDDSHSHSSRSGDVLVSGDAPAQDLSTSLVGGDYSLLLDVSPASPLSMAATTASSSIPPLAPRSPLASSSSSTAALHAWLRSTSSPSSRSSSSTPSSNAQAHPHPVLRKMASEEKTDQAVQASFPAEAGAGEGDKSVVLESMGSSAATVVPGSVVVRKEAGGVTIVEEKRIVVDAPKDEDKTSTAMSRPTTTARTRDLTSLDASCKSTTTKAASARACSSGCPSRADAPPDLAWTLGPVLALCMGLWVLGSWMLNSEGRAGPASVAVSTPSPASQGVQVVSSAVTLAPSTTAVERTADPIASSPTAPTASATESATASSASAKLDTKSWTSFLGLGSAPVRSALPAAPELARLEGGDRKGEAGAKGAEIQNGAESTSTSDDTPRRVETDEDDAADSSSPFLLDAPEEALKDLFSVPHMKELHGWFVAAGQRSSRRFQQDAQDVLVRLAKMRTPHEPEQDQRPAAEPSAQHDFSSMLTSLRLPGFDYSLDIDRVRSRIADLSASSTSQADQALRRAARSLDHLSSTNSHTLSRLSHSLAPVVDSAMERVRAGSRFSESKIKRAAWSAQVIERRLRWVMQGGAEEDYPKMCGCPFA